MSSEFSIRETDHLSIATLAAATNATFADYFMPVTHTPAGFAMFCRWNTIDTAQSVLLEHQDGRIAGLSVLATRGARGWCGGFGIVPEFRGRGLSATLVNGLMGRACSFSLTSLSLEVLTQNAKAIKAYARAGFQIRRDLVVLSGDLAQTALTSDTDLRVEATETPEQAWAAALALPGPTPCWQREVVSLLSMTEVHGLVARRDAHVVGVLLYRSNLPTGPLALMHLAFTDKAAAQALLARAVGDTGMTQTFNSQRTGRQPPAQTAAVAWTARTPPTARNDG